MRRKSSVSGLGLPIARMKTTLCLLLALGAWISSFPGRAQDKGPVSHDEALKIVNRLKFQQGEVTIGGGLAKLQVPADFNFLGQDDARTLLVRLWHNPPAIKTLGLLIPADKSPLEPDCWVVTISYTEEGYVKDGDANKINYDDLLKKMQQAATKANPQREKQGYPPVELVGWAAPPRYDAAAHKLYWAKELKFGRHSKNTLNYNIRVLGRRGVLELNAVSSMSQLGTIEAQAPQILAMVNFNDGNRYADFDPKVDKVATYGIAALVAGGIAAKLGLFKVIWVFLLAAKKFIIIGIAAMAAWARKLFSKSRTPNPGA